MRDSQPLDEVKALAAQVDAYCVDYVGLDLSFDGIAVQCDTGDAEQFKQCVAAVSEANNGPLILVSNDPAILEAGISRRTG